MIGEYKLKEMQRSIMVMSLSDKHIIKPNLVVLSSKEQSDVPQAKRR